MLHVLKTWSERYFGDEEAVLLALLLVGGLAFILYMGGIVAPVIAAVIIAFLMQGLVSRLKSWGSPHLLAVSVSTLVLLTAIIIACFFLMPLIWRQLAHLFTEIPGMLVEWQAWLLLLPEQYPQLISTEQVEELISVAGRELGALGQTVFSFSLSSLPMLMMALVYMVVVPMLVFFFLKDSEQILSWVASFLPKKRPRMKQIWTEMNAQVANYVRGKVIEILVIGTASCIVFAALDLNYALLLGLAVGLSVLIPYIGATVVTVPVVLIGVLQWGLTPDFYWMFAAYLVIQGLDGNLLVPLLFSEVVNIHPVAIIISVLFFGGLWGLWGVFFAIPLATLFKAIYSAWHLRPEKASMDVAVSE